MVQIFIEELKSICSKATNKRKYWKIQRSYTSGKSNHNRESTTTEKEIMPFFILAVKHFPLLFSKENPYWNSF